MLKNYLTTAFRSLQRFKLFTFLNVFGLATGMACSILIFLWVQDETSYDKFNADAEKMYRLTADIAGTPAAVTPPPILPAIKQQIPGIQAVTRVVPISANITIGNRNFGEKKILYTDPNFLQMFNYPLLEGQSTSALDRPDGVVLTEETAIKYFGSNNVIGKMLHVDNDINGHNYQVTAILKNIPHNSHLQFSLLLPIDFYNRDNGQVWNNFSAYSYIRLSSKFAVTAMSLKKLGNQINTIYKANDKSNTKSNFTLQPLTDIHLHSRLVLDVEDQGNIQYVTIFFMVALFILLLACINFINLYTALGSQRAKEVGLRKTIGALRSQLIAQFMSESMLVALCSLITGCIIAWLLLPLFNQLTDKAIFINFLNMKLITELLALAIVVGLVSGSYPAFFMSAFNPAKVLKGLKITTGGKSYLRNGLVIFQFSIAVVLIISTIVINYQLRFIRNRDIGFNKQNLMYMEMPRIGNLHNNYQALKASLIQWSAISDYTLVDRLPVNLTSATSNVNWSGKDPKQQILFPHIGIDGKFIKTFGMHLLAGRSFNDQTGDDNNYILNEKAVKLMGLTAKKAIGQKISSNGHEGQIIGVVKDFNFKPVQQPIEPLIMNHTNHGGYLILRTTPKKLQSFITMLKEIFKGVYSNAPFAYSFVDEDLSRMYVAEQRMEILVNTFSIISIAISCLGLFGLATFATQRRIKEIGVRRVLGASVIGLTGMLMKDFIKLVILSFVIAFPIGWYSMNNWLSNYAYRIELNWWFFAIAGIAAITIALLTISYQSIKTALSNPVESLRTE